MDEDTANFKELKWARLLVRSEGLEWPSSLQVAVGSICYSIQLWWEAKPGLTAVIPATKNEKGNEREVRDEGEGDSRAGFKMMKVWPTRVMEGDGAPKGGKSWFAVESKTFEISIEETRDKLRGVIMERSKGFSSWIKFGEKSLSSLLEGVEDWCREESSSRRLRVWEKGGRKYRLECHSNGAGRYLLCSVRDLEAKRFCLVFPEGKGLVGGWFLLAQKLRALGIANQSMRNVERGNSTSAKEDYRGKGKEKAKGIIPDAVSKEKGELGEALWVHVGERDLTSREVQLNRCLVGVFGDSVEVVPSLPLLEEWAYESWSLKGGLKISRLGGALVLFEFEDKVEADWVLLRGSRSLQRREFFLQKWGPEVGCCRNGSYPKEVWVKVVGLPLHLWSREVFKSIGERCGGFIAVDEDTAFFSELQWARILVRAPGKISQGSLQVVAGNCCWTVSLWWENPPGFSEVVARSPWLNEERREVRDEGGGDSRATGSVRGFQKGKSELQARGTGDQLECGSGQGVAAGAEMTEGRRPFAGASGPSNSGFRPRKDEGQALKGNKVLGLSEERFWAKSPLPDSFKEAGWGWASKPTSRMDFVERSSSARASTVPAEVEERTELELMAFQEKAVMLTSRGWRVADEALMEEASRYDAGPTPPSQLGHRGDYYPSSSSFGGNTEAVGTSEGVFFGAKGEPDCFETRMERNRAATPCGDWSGHRRDLGEAERGMELALVPAGEVFMSLCEEEDACLLEEGGSGEGWSTSSLARFSHCLGMPTEGFEEEILYLLRRMKGRMEQKGREGVTRKTNLKSSKSSRELKKLEWTVSYKKAKMGSSTGIFGGTSGSGSK